VNIEKMFHVRCRLDYDSEVIVPNHAVATHLFRLAQEAVSNAIKHGKATEVAIHLKSDPGWIYLGISDNGIGFEPDKLPATGGMGLRIMKFRAGMIGGTLTIERNGSSGMVVMCTAPIPAADGK
jgi:signal transduction histidine kinase